jgi:SNF2 family DNA or RNA helicase
MLQLLTGAVYHEDGSFSTIHTDRYDLVMQLVDERPQSVVAFNWRHERVNLCKLADAMGITYGVIDGEVPVKEREQIVRDFQDGKLRVIFAHPQSAGHGLTLTAGHATIWASPTYNAEHFQQFNRRIYRTGQTKRTETIRIAARGTCEEEVYTNLNGKLVNMQHLLNIALQLSDAA